MKACPGFALFYGCGSMVRAALMFLLLALVGLTPAGASAQDRKKCWVLVHAFGASGDFWQKQAPLGERQ